jgi:hypothetical protein
MEIQFFSNKEAKDFQWWIQGHTFKVDAKILDLVTYDLILGMDWLEQHRPMTCDWLLKWIDFYYQGSKVGLQGIVPSEPDVLHEISGEQLYKLAKSHDVWSLVVVMTVSQDDRKQEEYLMTGIPPKVQQVIHDNSKLFDTPNSLPPSWAFDHAIFLYPGSTPVNCRPYMYAPH